MVGGAPVTDATLTGANASWRARTIEALASISEAVYILDAEDRVTWGNTAAERLPRGAARGPRGRAAARAVRRGPRGRARLRRVPSPGEQPAGRGPPPGPG